ncbi:conserved exported protein of unknown function [Georgfuchsia toluolica]|uniref:Uncharacterized protein n=1 Tax=Georgfuchsia toluolica TaxID=424218 RepID=A0A916N931_9PROT|nr:DUF6448 family protein [Georgfuchsia toluolica]CAG4883360.1 conserved exported protein of unknown function [Georgfuchsia toluolica]
MNFHQISTKASALAAISMALLFAAPASAHCDGVDGPVVKAAQQALDTGNVNRVLIWVQHTDEAQIKDAFRKTLEVRKLNPSARELADNYFFETLVRVHRAGEGAPYTGIKPAGRDLGPAIPAGDKALETGSVEPVVKLLTERVQKGLREQFNAVISKKNFNRDDVAAGREFIEAYVEYIHYVERLYEVTKEPAKGHYSEAGAHAHAD